jgi:hypothetical protein
MPAMPSLSKLALAAALLSFPLTATAADWPNADVDRALAVIAAGKPDIAACLKDFKTVMSHDVRQRDLNSDGVNELVVSTMPAAFGEGPSQGAFVACFGDHAIMNIAISDGKGGWVDNIGYNVHDLIFHDRPDSAWPDVELQGKMGCAPIYRHYKDRYTLWKTCDHGGNHVFADATLHGVVPSDFGIDTFKTSYPAANTAGDEYLHNGSTMYVSPELGLISYKAPKRSIARTVDQGDVVFKAKPWNPENHNLLIEGTAYTFKKGCAPAPYFVTGLHRADGTLVLRGAAPMRDKRSCAIRGYSHASGNAELVFTPTTPSLGAWPGSYAGTCGNDNRVQCTLEVDAQGGALAVKLEVANRFDGFDVKCLLTGTFNAAGSEIHGAFDRAPAVRIAMVGYDLRVTGVPKSACGVKLAGDYRAFGD